MNSWDPINTGAFLKVEKNEYVIWRTKHTPSEAIQKNGGRLILKKTTGVVEIWINGKLTTINSNLERTDITVIIPPKKGELVISVLMKETNLKAGIGGMDFLLD